MTKEPKGTFLSEGKEPVIERIFQLVERYPSRSAAARAWGININTLKNYYRRKDIQPVPRRNQLQKIANQENVSLRWLLTGEPKDTKIQEKEPERDIQIQTHSNHKPQRMKRTEEKLLDMLRLLSDEKLEEITRQLMLKGVETILYLLDENNLLLLQQPDTLKAHMLQEYVTGKPLSDSTDKVCARESEGTTPTESLVDRHKKAG